MKRLLLSFILLTSLSSFSQDIPKHTNTITAYESSFDKVMKQLLSDGYTLDKIEKDYGYIKTGFKLIPGTKVQVSFNIVVSDSSSTIRGEWQHNKGGQALISAIVGGGAISSNVAAEIYPIEKDRSAVGKATFKMMNDFAGSVGSNLVYEIRK